MPKIALDLPDLRDTGAVFPVVLCRHSKVAKPIVDELPVDVPPVATIAMIDTGASRSTVKRALAESLLLTPIRELIMHTASHSDIGTYEYAIQLRLADDLVIEHVCLDATMDAHRFGFLIGRDILSKMTLLYEGSENRFSLFY